jgi:methyl-galactoside transport system substrate-binding protein
MKILKKCITLLITIALSIEISNIQYTASASTNFNRQNMIKAGILLYSFDDLYMNNLKQNLENFQNTKNNVNFTFFSSKDNQAIQNEILDSLFKDDYNLLMLYLINPTKDQLTDIINKARQKNISLIFFDINPSDIINDSYDKIAFFITDSNKSGNLQGEILANEWNKNKNILDKNNDNVLQYILLKGATNSLVTTERTNAVIAKLKDSGINLQELATVNALWDKDFAESAINSLFLKYDGEIEAITSNNDAMAIGAVASLQKYGYNKGDNSKYIPIVGIDGLKEAKDLIAKGMMTGTVSQDLDILADSLYNVGMNLIYNEDSLQSVPYKLVNDKIVVTLPYSIYTKQSNNK